MDTVGLIRNENLSSKNAIKQIDQRSVHQICSGQVILSLATAVKELVENSIDAGATNIEIKLKEFGVESIEVQDNGFGIEEKDFEALALKHFTSKLRDFEDLSLVETFGFRGEALSSLCALSKMTISTRHKSKAFGSKLEFDYNGKLVSNTPCARESGTTVIVNKIFHTLPVRHKEFQRNIKREFPKLNVMLQAYGIISTGVRISCINISDKNKKTILMSSPGSECAIENIASIFGPKQVESLLKFTQSSPEEEVIENFNISQKNGLESKCLFSIDGYISQVDHGCGRSSLDRQFYFINKRPCDFMKISRLVNEIYHMFNRNQNPFVFLDISLNTDMVDINITPDKRQIFIQNERMLLATLKSSLLKMFVGSAASYEINLKHEKTLSNEDSRLIEQNALSFFEESPKNESRGNCSTSSKDSDNDEIANEDEGVVVKQQSSLSFMPNKSKIPNVSSISSKFSSRFTIGNKGQISKGPTKIRHGSMDKFTFIAPKPKKFLHIFANGTNEELRSNLLENSASPHVTCQKAILEKDKQSHPVLSKLVAAMPDENQNQVEETFHDDQIARQNLDGENHSNVEIKLQQTLDTEIILDHLPLKASIIRVKAEHALDKKQDKSNILVHAKADPFGAEESGIDMESNLPEHFSNDQRNLNIPLKRLRLTKPIVETPFDIDLLEKQVRSNKERKDFCDSNHLLGFHAKITPQQNNEAEEELRKNISKHMFKQMQIIGQFNLGFIIAKLDEDLFIIDQHASDEKYNFETLQREHCLKGQRLIHPRPLELTPVNECILLDNVEIFYKNGFNFLVDLEKPAGQKVKLVSLPTSKNWTFDVEDIDELIFMLSDNPGIMCRPSRVRSMFASRACRMSTMVGKALNNSQMKNLVSHMADIEHPWNCPHGRPTMRHLVNLKRIDTPSFSQTQSEE